MKAGNLRIIGTSHIARESIEAVSAYIASKKPEIVALELDPRRAHALMHGSRGKLSLKMIKKVGVNGFLFLALASFLQKKLGRLVGVEPGAEMKAALEAAIREKAKIALIDRSLEITMNRLSRALTWKERLRFVADVFSAPFSGEMKEFRNTDLRKVPDRKLIAGVLQKIKKSYPSFYGVLVEERNRHMAARLAHIMKTNPGSHVLAVVGAGHEDELAGLVRDCLSADRGLKGKKASAE